MTLPAAPSSSMTPRQTRSEPSSACTSSWVTYGGLPFTRGRLYHLLSNPIYVGEIRHKDKSYPGQHPPIVDWTTFTVAQKKLETNRQRGRRRVNCAQPSPLAGKFVDETGDRLTPSHAKRRGKRHRYYVSRRLISNSGNRDADGWRLPAKTLEDAVASLLVNAMSLHSLIIDAPPEILQRAHVAAKELTVTLTGPDRGSVLSQVLDVGRIAPGQIFITLSRDAIASRLGVPIRNINANGLNQESDFTLRRRGVEARVILGDTPTSADTVLLNNLAQGFAWFEQVKAGESLKAIADRHGVTRRRISSLIDLSFLAPDIVQAIVDGRQPLSLTANRLAGWRHRHVWDDQRAWLSTV